MSVPYHGILSLSLGFIDQGLDFPAKQVVDRKCHFRGFWDRIPDGGGGVEGIGGNSEIA